MATYRQRLVASKMSENIRNGKLVKPMGQILRESGYSESVCKHPDRVTNTKVWQKLMDKYLPEVGLARKHNQLLEATTLDHYTFPNSMTDTEIKEIVEKVPGWILIRVERTSQCAKAYLSIPDNNTQLKMLELAYKIKGKYSIKEGGENDQAGQEIREAIFRIRRILPASEL